MLGSLAQGFPEKHTHTLDTGLVRCAPDSRGRFVWGFSSTGLCIGLWRTRPLREYGFGERKTRRIARREMYATARINGMPLHEFCVENARHCTNRKYATARFFPAEIYATARACRRPRGPP